MTKRLSMKGWGIMLVALMAVVFATVLLGSAGIERAHAEEGKVPAKAGSSPEVKAGGGSPVEAKGDGGSPAKAGPTPVEDEEELAPLPPKKVVPLPPNKDK